MKKRKTTHVILGVCTHTTNMTEMLEKAGATDIAVIDYEAKEDHIQVAQVHFYSPGIAKQRLESSREVVFHKFLTRRKK